MAFPLPCSAAPFPTRCFAEVASREIAATRDLVAAEQAATDVTAVLSEKDAMFSLAAEMLVEGEGRDFDVRDC